MSQQRTLVAKNANSWAAWGKVWPASQWRWLFPFIQPWQDYIWHPALCLSVQEGHGHNGTESGRASWWWLRDWSLMYEEKLRAETADSRRAGLAGGSGMHINIWQKTVKKMETDFSVVFQWRNKKQQPQAETQEIPLKHKKKNFFYSEGCQVLNRLPREF